MHFTEFTYALYNQACCVDLPGLAVVEFESATVVPPVAVVAPPVAVVAPPVAVVAPPVAVVAPPVAVVAPPVAVVVTVEEDSVTFDPIILIIHQRCSYIDLILFYESILFVISVFSFSRIVWMPPQLYHI